MGAPGVVRLLESLSAPLARNPVHRFSPRLETGFVAFHYAGVIHDRPVKEYIGESVMEY